ncbi:hypothetical protein [Paenibacillus protaetiae]|uniref:Uncharacterized protein n=1 Tax=Paenibacillus protaetiae TaxID=2509456 RepID=A0A4P6EX99_9BACL|nr:hypothetical protein [Paenibacillus protaetiae]QAY65227.1 hypothetical protein ET464_01345 [Paenibacillus protaetiae]
MIKLLKYDWKRNMDGVLSTLGILIAIQIVLPIVWEWRNWDSDTRITLGGIAYMAVAFALFASACRTYAYGLTRIHRRLLPVHPAAEFAAPLLLGTLYLVVLALIGIIQIGLTGVVHLEGVGGSEIFSAIAAFVVGVVFSYSLVFVCITVACSIRWKQRTLIGVALFVALINLNSYITDALFSSSTAFTGGVTFRTNTSTVVIEPGSFPHIGGDLLLNLVFAVLFMAVSVALVKTKVEI